MCTPGDDLGQISACCKDATGCCCLIVEKLQQVATISQHSSKFCVAHTTRALWHMHEVTVCVAWKIEHGEITAIAM